MLKDGHQKDTLFLLHLIIVLTVTERCLKSLNSSPKEFCLFLIINNNKCDRHLYLYSSCVCFNLSSAIKT